MLPAEDVEMKGIVRRLYVPLSFYVGFFLGIVNVNWRGSRFPHYRITSKIF